MATVLRSWLGFLGLGAGMLHIALTIGSPPAVAAGLLLVGAAEFAWGVFCLARPSVPLARVARAAAVAPVVAWALILVIAGADALGPLTSADRLAPMLVASLFDLLVTGLLTGMLRPRPARPAEPRPPRSGRALAAVIAGALVVAALTAPALAGTEAIRQAGPGYVGHEH